MANQLQRGETFLDNGSSYASADLHTLVENAKILPPAITDQTDAGPVVADNFLFYQVSSGNLRKCTFQELISGFPADASAGTQSLRSLGAGAGQAVAGNDTRIPASVTGVRLSAGGGSTDVAAGPKDLAFAPVNLSGGLSVDWDTGDIFYDTLTGSTSHAYTFANVRPGRVVQVIFKTQGYTGTITWPTLLGTSPIQSAGATVQVYTFENCALGTIGLTKAL
jgi:hypothetical protein